MTFWYLASPYTVYEQGFDAACELVSKAAGKLMKAGLPVFSPIVHSHTIAIHAGLDKINHGLWMTLNRPFMDAACGLIVLKGEGWTQSVGIAEEIKRFEEAKKPILYMSVSHGRCNPA